MPQRGKKTRGKSSGQLSTLNEPVRTFRSFSGDLHKMADWLDGVGIKTVAMESTGVYWIPVFEILEARGFEVLPCERARREECARQEDRRQRCPVAAAASSARAFLRGSFRPRDEVVRLRAYLRHRERTVEYASAHVQRGNGKTMLDNSLVIWLNGMSEGKNHTRNNIPFVLAGGGAARSRAAAF